MITIWMTSQKAHSLGCTHHGRFLGLVPGFIEPGQALWISRSDLLVPVEEVLSFIWVTMRRLRGEEPDFMFSVGRPITNLPNAEDHSDD